MASSNLMSNVAGTGMRGWNGLPQEVIIFIICTLPILFMLCINILLFIFKAELSTHCSQVHDNYQIKGLFFLSHNSQC